MGILGDMVRRDLTGGFRKEDLLDIRPEGSSDTAEKQEIALIEKYDIRQLLTRVASSTFKLGRYNSLWEIIDDLGVSIKISPKIITRTDLPRGLEEARAYWKDRAKDNPAYENRYRDICKEIEELQHSKLRGSYSETEKEIILYPKEMEKEPEYGGEMVKALLASTFVHEVMHAYFSRHGRETLPYLYFVEEPLAEFGMLLFLHHCQDEVDLEKELGDLWAWFYNDVAHKMTCYRYGAGLMDIYIDGTQEQSDSVRKFLEDYRNPDMRCINYPTEDLIPACHVDGNKHADIHNATSCVKVVIPKWQSLFDNPPRYFYDDTTKTLGFGGDWCAHERQLKFADCEVIVHLLSTIVSQNNSEIIYLDDDFVIDDLDIFEGYVVKVSPRNKFFVSKEGKIVRR